MTAESDIVSSTALPRNKLETGQRENPYLSHWIQIETQIESGFSRLRDYGAYYYDLDSQWEHDRSCSRRNRAPSTSAATCRRFSAPAPSRRDGTCASRSLEVAEVKARFESETRHLGKDTGSGGKYQYHGNGGDCKALSPRELRTLHTSCRIRKYGRHSQPRHPQISAADVLEGSY
ncbi:hypothetical protein VTK26DRAFT_4548 [Humicola hyalothermophila]